MRILGTKRQTVADQMVATFEAAGVKRIYGLAGDSLNGFTDSLRRAKTIEWLHVRHEEVAAFAAGAEAHLTGELAVCAGSCGPGNLHLINGLFDCHRSRVPVIAIAAHIPSPEIGSGYFQETHPEQLFRECSGFCELVSSPAQMPRVLEMAIRHAVTNRCVAVIVIPGDVALLPAEDHPVPPAASLLPAPPRVVPAQETIEKLAAILNAGKKITHTVQRPAAATGRDFRIHHRGVFEHSGIDRNEGVEERLKQGDALDAGAHHVGWQEVAMLIAGTDALDGHALDGRHQWPGP